jgi:hypothetical protein
VRHSVEIQGIDKQSCRSDFATPVGSEKAAQLILMSPSPPLRLVLKRAKQFKLSLRIDHSFYRGAAESADQLVLEVCNADIEPETFHIGSTEV